MNTQLINKLAKQCETLKGDEDGYYTHFDREKFAKLIVEETIKLLNKGDPDFNAFSERLVRQHFGVR